MALIKCIECGKEISNLASACPNCGCPKEMQQEGLQDSSREPGLDMLNNPAGWEQVQNLIDSYELIRAKELMSKLLCVNYHRTNELATHFVSGGRVPVKFILELFPSQGVQPTTRPCKACNKTISVKAEKCPHCGEPTGVRVCPRCGSTDVVILDAVSKAVSMALFGAFSVNTVRSKYECWTCHFKF